MAAAAARMISVIDAAAIPRGIFGPAMVPEVTGGCAAVGLGGGARGGRERADQRPDRPGPAVLRESPVQQLRRIAHLGQRGAVQDRHDQRDAVPAGHPDIGRLRAAGPADLAADTARVLGQQLVLVEQRLRLAGRDREMRFPRRVVPHDIRHGQRLPGDQRQVVRGDVLAGNVEPVRVLRVDVVRLQVVRFGVYQRDAVAQRAGRLRQGDRGVVRRDEQQCVEQVGHLVGLAAYQPRDVRGDVGSLRRRHHRGVRVQQRGERDRRQHLQRARRAQQAVRVLGRQDLTGSGVGDHVRRRGNLGQRGRRAVHDHAAPGQLRAAHSGGVGRLRAGLPQQRRGRRLLLR